MPSGFYEMAPPIENIKSLPMIERINERLGEAICLT
jgi:hypothetical protein